MPSKLFNHNVKKVPWTVNARRYSYDGDHVQVPFNRNRFYKIWLIENPCRLQVNDKTYVCNEPVLFFASPLTGYAYDSLQQRRSGYWCAFTTDFLATGDPSGKIRLQHALDPAYAAVIFPAPGQMDVIKFLFRQLTEAVKGEFIFRDVMIFNYVQLLIFEGMKGLTGSLPAQKADAAVRITRLFLQLLDRQFPVQSPLRPMKLGKPVDFARCLAIHVNHLNDMVRKVTGLTTSEHITARKIAEAKVLLHHSDWTIADISAGLAFSYPNHFNTFFSRNTGTTPLQYRKMRNL